MKRLVIPVLAGLGLCFAQFSASAQEYKTHISKEFTYQKGMIGIYNLFGSVKVEGYSGNKVLMEIDETISADDQQTVDLGKKEFKLEFEQKPDSIITYISEPWDTRPHERHSYRHDHDRIEYSVKLEFVVKVPYNVDLSASTVNDGDVYVKNVYGTLNINNVNGKIDIVNAKGTTRAHTVNGGVTVNYLAVPPDASSYYTINGELKVTYPASLAADVSFKSMNGEFYTDFQNVEVMPSRVTKSENKSGSSTTYKLSKLSDIRFGAGGKIFKFETLNGNVYIKKQD
ncbi:MAG TPA: hypothetical protein VL442_10965 [Mucilaginibacter sp.]|jgi:hypothetical protein|nr:hypothetical protein [Mucilaginibacter sp.]